MVYETSYDAGRKPFSPDLSRGYWASPNDFIFLCLALAFKMDFYGLTWYFGGRTGIYIIFPYIFCLLIYGVPLMVVNMFMGQFPSTGFISSLRIAPFFKGIGLVSLGINVCILTYYATFATVPLIYFFGSFQPSIPWSCESAEKWYAKTACGRSQNNVSVMIEDMRLWRINHIPSVLYFSKLFDDISFYDSQLGKFEISWELLGCNILVWSIIGGIFYKFFEIEKFGKLMRYLICIALGILILCTIRFSFLPGVGKAIEKFFEFRRKNMIYTLPISTVSIISSFGGGWGVILTLASHNKFKGNIVKYSWIVSLGQLGINILLGLITSLVEEHYEHLIDNFFFSPMDPNWSLYLSSGTAIANLHWANLWSILYYGMLALIAIIIICIQIMTILVTLYDEFEILRSYKLEFRLGLIASLLLISTYYCSNHGLVSFFSLTVDSLLTSSTILLLILLVVLWIYGRERFQRDMEFMLSERFATWKVNSLRFIAPIGLTICMLYCAIHSYYKHDSRTGVVIGAAILFVAIPWLFIPIYGALGMLHTSGSCWIRFKRCCRPTDWYPVEPEHRQRYEETMGNIDITHELNEVIEEVL